MNDFPIRRHGWGAEATVKPKVEHFWYININDGMCASACRRNHGVHARTINPDSRNLDRQCKFCLTELNR